MKKLLWLCIIWCSIIQYSYACTQDSTPIEDDVLQNSYQLIIIATVSDSTPITGNNPDIWFLEPDIIYSLNTNKTFKWDDSVKEFSIAAETKSLCGNRPFQIWEKYLLYLNPSRVNSNRYVVYQPATVRVLHEDIDIPYDTIWEQLWYQISSTLKKSISTIQQFIINMQK
jgi:hypothetical protein